MGTDGAFIERTGLNWCRLREFLVAGGAEETAIALVFTRPDRIVFAQGARRRSAETGEGIATA